MINTQKDSLDLGHGLFETLLCYKGVIQDVEAHFERLLKSLLYYNMPLIDLLSFKKALEENVLEATCVVRMTYTFEKGKIIHKGSTRPLQYEASQYLKGFALCLSTVKRNSSLERFKHKTTHILDYQIALDQAKVNGFDEVLYLNEKQNITECSYSNVFIVKNNILYTPSIDSGILPGIQRQKIIDCAVKLGIPLEIGYYGIDRINCSDEAFITNSVMGIMPIASIGSKSYQIKKGDMTQRLIKELSL